jgi:hypothetical protein
MDVSSLKRTSPNNIQNQKKRLKAVMAVYTVNANNKKANKLRAYTFKPMPIKDQIKANKKLRSKSLKDNVPNLQGPTPISRYFKSFKL